MLITSARLVLYLLGVSSLSTRFWFNLIMQCVSILALALSVLGSVVANGVHARPWELVLRIDPLDGLCERVSFRSAQIHKDLLREDVITKVTPVPAPHPGESRHVLRVVSHDVHALLSQAQLHCTNDLSAVLPRLALPSIQVPLSRDDTLDTHIMDVDLPPLELIPLITSGPAENRVDLAFFADGCMYAVS